MLLFSRQHLYLQYTLLLLVKPFIYLYILSHVSKACLSSHHACNFFCCIIVSLCASFWQPFRGRNWGWWCITAAVWLWISTESFPFTGSSMRGTTSPPSGRRELQPSMENTTPWSYNSTLPKPLPMCLWGMNLLCYSVMPEAKMHCSKSTNHRLCL